MFTYSTKSVGSASNIMNVSRNQYRQMFIQTLIANYDIRDRVKSRTGLFSSLPQQWRVSHYK